MSERPPIIDADGHILERQSDIAKYLQPPWDRRTTPLFPGDQPWDHQLFHTRPGTQIGHDRYYEGDMSPDEQIAEWHRIMDREAIELAVCFPTGSGNVPKIHEHDFQVAVARACNDHFAQEYNARSDRIRCVGVLPLEEPAAAVAEVRRATALGLPGFELLTTGTERGLGDPRYHPIFAEAERVGAAMCIHGTRGSAGEVGGLKLANFNEVHCYVFPAAMLLQFTSVIFQGIPVLFPNLRLAFLEIGVSWLPYYLDRMDEHWEKRAEYEAPLLKKKPSDVVRESKIYFSIEAGESLLPQTVDYLGADHFVYASDIPHWDNEFPESVEHLWNRPDLSRDIKEKIIYHNAKSLFALDKVPLAA